MIVFEVVSVMPRVLSPVDLKRLGRILGRRLRVRSSKVVGVRFVSSSIMQQLNRRYRKVNRPTDVLSFQLTGVSLQLTGYLGDLVVCPSYARQSARRQKIDLREELIRLLAHGVLHLAGFDHATKSEEKKMFAIQERSVTETL
ncbi:MAG: rRNA maturation RNase YbeY [Candidatus Uhrbacteria bacterium]|nr:rRNA maturation RNase YbeY [Candidatus Uhrbacteria bacterium]